MAFVSRRQALMRTAVAAARADRLPALLPKLHAYPLDIPVGCQTHRGTRLRSSRIFRALTPYFFSARSKAGQVPIPVLDDHQGVRSGGLLYKVSGPVAMLITLRSGIARWLRSRSPGKWATRGFTR